MYLQRAWDAVTSVLFPAPCRVCDQPLLNATTIPICSACLEGFRKIEMPLCTRCGRPLHSGGGNAAANSLCRLCQSNFYSFDAARSFAQYDDSLSSAVLLLKYERITPLARWFAERLAEVVRKNAEWKIEMVVSVPLHRERLKERGYNQSDLLAKALANILKTPLAHDVLARTKPRPAQLVLSKREHRDSVRGAFVIHRSAQVDKKRVLLVDDVFTTGATLDSCSRALKKAGAATVAGVTIGRVTLRSDAAS